MNENVNNNTPKIHHYVDCGLDNVWLLGGFEEIESPYGPGVAIRDLDQLHRCIAQCLVQRPAPLTGKEFRFLRTELDLSQTAMGLLCGKNDRTIRNWEAGEVVEDPANLIIRHVYQQRFNSSANFEELSKLIQQFQAVDKELHETKLKIHELKMMITREAEGWQAKECDYAVAA